jgi:hypothetical protein
MIKCNVRIKIRGTLHRVNAGLALQGGGQKLVYRQRLDDELCTIGWVMNYVLQIG